jgi:glycosyltransferase involved in cell wall biosynthesis
MKTKILVLTFWGYKEPLVANFTLPYLKILHEVVPSAELFLVTLEKPNQSLDAGELKKINNSLKADYNASLLSFRHTRFGPFALFQWALRVGRLIFFIRRKKITHIHAFCTPAGALGYLLKLFCKTELIIESFEPHAESMVESGVWTKRGLNFKILFWLEKKQAKSADCLIYLTEAMGNYVKEKYKVLPRKTFVKASCIDVTKFSDPINIKNAAYLRKLDLEEKVVGLYAGKFGGLYLEKEIFKAIKAGYDLWGKKFRMLILGNSDQAFIKQEASQLGIPGETILALFVQNEELPYYMGAADFALTFVKPIPSKRYCSPIKDSEYWTLGLPIIIPSGISDDAEIVDAYHSGYVLHELTMNEYQNAMRWVDQFLSSENKQEIKKQVRSLAIETRSMERVRQIYLSVYSEQIQISK